MLIIAGTLTLDVGERERYMSAVADVVAQARRAPGCFDFVQAPDLIDPTRINIYERWASDEDLENFRSSGAPAETEEEPALPQIKAADVAKYRIAAVEAP
jgi:quinol monooxygenase YgiN